MAAPSRPRKTKKASDYEETPDWGTAFQRAENTPPQPGFTGTGVLSAETLDAINNGDGSFRISIWTLDRDGKPLRNRDGSRRFRCHIEGPWDGDGDGVTTGSARNGSEPEQDDIPF